MRSRVFAATSALVAAGALLAGCSGGSSSGSDDEAADGPVTLEYWAWGTAQDPMVDAWNKAHPDIQVKHTDAGGGSDSSAKLLTATRAHNAPDVSVVEYQTLPAMIVGDVAADITPYVDDDLKSKFTDATWGLTTFNDAIYGI